LHHEWSGERETRGGTVASGSASWRFSFIIFYWKLREDIMQVTEQTINADRKKEAKSQNERTSKKTKLPLHGREDFI